MKVISIIKLFIFALILATASGITIPGIPDKTYTGRAIKPKIKVKDGDKTLKENTDYRLTYKDNVKVGTAIIYVDLIGRYRGTYSITFKIIPIDISNNNKIECSSIPDQPYTGKVIKPDFVITYTFNNYNLKEGIDYTYKVTEDPSAGKKTITVYGRGNFKGTYYIYFNVVRDIATCNFSSIPDQPYTGDVIEPELVITCDSYVLKRGTDYTYNGLKDPSLGKKIIMIVGHGYYDGIKSVFFNIVPRDIATCNFSSIPDQPYTGKAINPEVEITIGSYKLKKGTDYTYNGMNDSTLGKKIITLIGHGNFDGIKSVFFNIVPRDIATCNFSSIPDQPYTGKAIEPELVITNGSNVLKVATDYTYNAMVNTNVGQAIIIIIGHGNYNGIKSVFFNIVKS